MKITIETTVKADPATVWAAWNNPADLKQWNAASPDWHTTRSAIDLREGGVRRGDREHARPATPGLAGDPGSLRPPRRSEARRQGRAAELAVDEHVIIKTLVMEDDAQRPFLILMHGDREVSTRQLARAIGARSVVPVAEAAARRVTG